MCVIGGVCATGVVEVSVCDWGCGGVCVIWAVKRSVMSVKRAFGQKSFLFHGFY